MKSQLNFRGTAYFFILVISLGSVFSQSTMANPTASLQEVARSNDDEEEQKESSSSSSQAAANPISKINPAPNANLSPNTSPFKNSEILTLLRVFPRVKLSDGTLFNYDPVVRFPIYKFLGFDSLISFPSQYDRVDFAQTLPFYSVIHFRNMLKTIDQEQIDRISDPDLVHLRQCFEAKRDLLLQDPLTSWKVSRVDELEKKIERSIPIVQLLQLNRISYRIQYHLKVLNSDVLSVCNESNPCARLKRLIVALEAVQTEINEKLGEPILHPVDSDLLELTRLSILEELYWKSLTSVLNVSTGERHHVHFGKIWEFSKNETPNNVIRSEVRHLSNNIADHEKFLKKVLESQDSSELFSGAFIFDYLEHFKSVPMPPRLLELFLQLILKTREQPIKVTYLVNFDRQFIN